MANIEQSFEYLCKIYSKSEKDIVDKNTCKTLFVAISRNNLNIAKFIIQRLNDEIQRKTCRCSLYTIPSLWDWLRMNCYEDSQYKQLLSKKNIV